MASRGKYRDALALIKKENPLPAVCGRICNKRCEDACTRGTIEWMNFVIGLNMK